jgi:hypothetical protein
MTTKEGDLPQIAPDRAISESPRLIRGASAVATPNSVELEHLVQGIRFGVKKGTLVALVTAELDEESEAPMRDSCSRAPVFQSSCRRRYRAAGTFGVSTILSRATQNLLGSTPITRQEIQARTYSRSARRALPCKAHR